MDYEKQLKKATFIFNDGLKVSYTRKELPASFLKWVES